MRTWPDTASTFATERAAPDEDGLDLSGPGAVRAEAAKSVADVVRDAVLSAPLTGKRW